MASLIGRAPARPPLALAPAPPGALVYATRREAAAPAVEDKFYVGERGAMWQLAALYANFEALAPTEWHVHSEHMLHESTGRKCPPPSLSTAHPWRSARLSDPERQLRSRRSRGDGGGAAGSN